MHSLDQEAAFIWQIPHLLRCLLETPRAVPCAAGHQVFAITPLKKKYHEIISGRALEAGIALAG